MERVDFDVVIVGGGMVGASLAVALRPLGLDVAIVERQAWADSAAEGYDERSTAISLGSKQILATVGVWQRLAAAATPIHTVHVSDRGRFGVTRLAREEEGVEALGYVVENHSINAALREGIADSARLFAPQRVDSARPEADFVELVLGGADGNTRVLRTRLLVAADGARSSLRDALGIGARSHDYGQTAIVANVTPQHFHRNIAYERFTDNGPLALLPLGNGRCSLVWTVASADAPEILALEDSEFLGALQQAFGYRLGRFLRAGARAAWPLTLVEAERQTGPRSALLGNAAHGVHPVAGQGFNLALRGVAALAEVIAEAGADAGAESALARFEDWRRADQKRVVRMTDGLVRIFTNPLLPVRAARAAALFALDLLPDAKHRVARDSMGLAGRLPRLARGVALR